jgi:hypothetical protein
MDQALLQDDVVPGPLRDELLKDFDPSQETYEEYLQRKSLGERPFNMNEGGRIGFDSGGKADQLLKVYLEEGANSPIKREVKKAILKNPAFKKFIGEDKLKELATFSGEKKGWTERNLISNFTTYRDHMNKLPNKGEGYISSMKLADKLGIPESTFWKNISRGKEPQYNWTQIKKVLGEPQTVIGERGTGNKFYYYKDPGKKEVKALQKFFERPILGKDTVTGLNAFFNDTELMKMLDDRIFPDIEDAQRVLKKANLPASEQNAATAMLRLAEVLQGKKFKNEIDIEPNKVLGNYIYKQIDDFDMTHPWARGVYDAAVREIAENMPTQVGSIEKYKTLLKSELPDGFLEKKKLNMNEIFSVKASARNKAYPYAYFIDVIDRKLNQNELAKFHGHLSKAQTNLKNKIGQIRQTENPKFRKALYKEAEDIVKKFEGTRKRWRKTIKKNYSGKNFNLPNIVLGKEKEILAKDMKIAENIYKKADLDKWAAKGVDIAGHAKKTGYVMTGAADKTAMFAPDKEQQIKILKQMGYRCPKASGGGETLECYLEDVKKTKAEARKGNVQAAVKQRNAFRQAKKIPQVAKLLRRGIQGVIGGVGTAIGGKIGLALEGALEGGIYDYYRGQGYNHEQALQEGFLTKAIDPENYTGLFNFADELIEKEKIGTRWDPSGKVNLAAKYADAQSKYNEALDKYSEIQNQRPGNLEQSQAQQAALAEQEKIIRALEPSVKAGTPEYEAYQQAEERQTALMDKRARDYKSKNRFLGLEWDLSPEQIKQRTPSDFKERQMLKQREKEMEEYKGGQEAFTIKPGEYIDWGAYGLDDEEGIKEKWRQLYEIGGIDLLDRIGIAGGVSNLAEGGIASLKRK